MNPPPTQTQVRLLWMGITSLAVAVLLSVIAGFVWGLGRLVELLAPVLWPLAVAGVVAYLFDPIVSYLAGRGWSRVKAIVVVYVLAVLVISALLASVVPQLVAETQDLASRVPEYATRLEKKSGDWLSHPPPWFQKLFERHSETSPETPPVVSTNTEQLSPATNAAPVAASSGTNAPPLFSQFVDKQTLQTAAGSLAEGVRRAAPWLFGRVVSWFGILAGLALVPVYVFYFLLEKERISSRWTDYLPLKDSALKSELVFLLTSINNYLIAFFRGQVLVAMCDGILYSIGFLIIGLPYALLIGAAAMLLTIVPYVGAFIICTTAFVIALVQSGHWQQPMLVLLVFGIVQLLEGLVISPKIMGGRVGLHPVTIIIAVMAGTTLLGGLLGGILAIPLTAVLRVVMFRYVWTRPGERPRGRD